MASRFKSASMQLWCCFPEESDPINDAPQRQSRPQSQPPLQPPAPRVVPRAVRDSMSSVSSDAPTSPILNTVRLSTLFESSRVSVTNSTFSTSPGPRYAAQTGSASVPASAQVVWALPQGPMQRLNVSEGALVSPDYISGLEPGTEVDNNLLESQDRLWRRLYGVKLSLCMVTQHVGYVRHHLRGGDQHSHHHEIWRMFLIHAPANESAWLWPVGRESDFESLENLDLFMVRFTTYKDGVTWLDLSDQQLTELPPGLAGMVSLHRLELHCNCLTSITSDIAALTALDYLSLHRNHISYVTPCLSRLTRLRWLSLNANGLTEVPELPCSVERLSLHMNGIEDLVGTSSGRGGHSSGSGQGSGDGGGGGGSEALVEAGEANVPAESAGGGASGGADGEMEADGGGSCRGGGGHEGMGPRSGPDTTITAGPCSDRLGCSEVVTDDGYGQCDSSAQPHERLWEAGQSQLPQPPHLVPYPTQRCLPPQRQPQQRWPQPKQPGHELEGGPLSRCTKLSVLSLFTNRLSYLPPSAVAAWRCVNKLALQRNQLEEVPEEIGNLTELEDLWLYNNRLTRLPDALGRLPKLRKLWATDNRLTTVPASLGNCAALEELYVGRNQLEALPVDALLTGCSLLVRLQVGGNPGLDTSGWPAGLQDILI